MRGLVGRGTDCCIGSLVSSSGRDSSAKHVIASLGKQQSGFKGDFVNKYTYIIWVGRLAESIFAQRWDLRCLLYS